MNFVGYSYAEQGVRLEEAERLVRRALELKPRSGHLLDSLGWVLLRRGEHRRAVEVLEQAESLAGPNATIQEHLGDAYRAAQTTQAARVPPRARRREAGEDGGAADAGRRAAIERKLRELGATARSHATP
jgi:Flp pilus assembly protein TadD